MEAPEFELGDVADAIDDHESVEFEFEDILEEAAAVEPGEVEAAVAAEPASGGAEAAPVKSEAPAAVASGGGGGAVCGRGRGAGC